jgi:DNA repair exonuclease SbcCD ATPase subunit
MASESSSFNIDLKTTADLSGLKSELAALEEAAATAKRMGIAAAGADEQIAKLKQNIANVEQAAKHSEEGFKVFGRGAHEAHAVVDALGEVAPGFERLAHFLAEPVTAAIGLSILLFQKFSESMKEAQAAMQSLIDTPDARGEWVEKMADALERATVEGNVWEHEMQRIINAHETLREKTDELVRAEERQIQSTNQITQARKSLNEAYVDFLAKIGKIPEEKVVEIKFQIDEAAFRSETEQKLKGLQAEWNARTSEQSQNAASIPKLHGAAMAAAATATGAEQAKIKNEKKLEQDKNRLEESKANQERAEKIIEELEGKGTWGGEYDKSDPEYYKLKSARETQQAELDRQGDLRRSIKTEEDRRAGLDTNAETTKADKQKAQSEYEDALKRASDLKGELGKLKGDLEAETAKVAAIETTHKEANDPNYFSDRAGHDAAQSERGGAAQIGAADTVTKARMLESQFQGKIQGQTISPDDLREIHETIERIMGYLENRDVGGGRKADMRSILDRLQRLENSQHSDPYFGD